MSPGADWLDEIAGQRFDWTRISPGSMETELRPGLPCRIIAGEVDGHPVLYTAVGVNGRFHYWQMASLDRKSRRPLPKAEAFGRLWETLEFLTLVSQSEVRPAMIDWGREVA